MIEMETVVESIEDFEHLTPTDISIKNAKINVSIVRQCSRKSLSSSRRPGKLSLATFK